MTETKTLTAMTATITKNFVSKNLVSGRDIGAVIETIYAALAGLEANEPEAPPFVPATTIRKSLANPAKIISMIDGKPYSMLKRHLRDNGLTPDEYRQRYHLPADYPITAPAYSQHRKALAEKIGLGRRAKPEDVIAVATPGRRKLRISTPAA